MTFSEAIIKIRSDLRISQQELAKLLMVSYASVNRWENGKHIPNKMTLRVITDFCNNNQINFEYDEKGSDDI